MENAVDKVLADVDTLKRNLISESMSTLGLKSKSFDKSLTMNSQSGIANSITRKPFFTTTQLSLNQGNRGLLGDIGDVIKKLVKKGVDWLSNLFGGSRSGSFGNRGMNQMMSLEQGSVDVALEHMSKMKNVASMSQYQAFRSNTPNDATDAEIVQESVGKGIENAVDKFLAGVPESQQVDELKQNLIEESMSTLDFFGMGLGGAGMRWG